MTFKVWDNNFAGYMQSGDGVDAEFHRKVDADRAIQNLFHMKTRQDEWLMRLDVHHLEANLCYHLRQKVLPDGSSQHYPWLLPVFFDVPRSNWKLLADDDGSEISVGVTVTVRGEKYTLDSFQPPHKMASEGRIVVVDAKGGRRRYFAGVVGGTFKYLPPETALSAAGLVWASRDWTPVRTFQVPLPRTIVLPPQPNWTEYFLGHLV